MRRVPASAASGAVKASGVTVSLTGIGLVAAGVWARREVKTTLARERIVSTADSTPPSAPVTSGAAARSLAEAIRRSTLEAANGRTYAETDLFLDAARRPTSDRERALEDERSGQPVENPEHTLWLQATTLQTALMQAYMASRLAALMIGLGGAFLAVGAGLTAAGRDRR